MNQILIFLLTITAVSLFVPEKSLAVCPVCTVAVAGGLGLSRYLGIDDTVTGVWIGGLILASGLWLADWIGKKGWKIPSKEFLSVLLLFIMVIPPLYWGKLIGLHGNTLWGIDKVLLGTIIGSFLFIVGVWLDKWLRTTNSDKVYVYYQKVIIPVFLLSLASFIFYLITFN